MLNNKENYNKENYSKVNSKEDNYNHVLNNLQDYMLTEENIIKSMDQNIYSNKKNIPIPNPVTNVTNNSYNKEVQQKVNNEKVTKKEKMLIPNRDDSLFWCFYVIKNGYDKYEMLDINIVVEKKLKIEYIEKLRKEKALLKTFKIASLTHIENQLANEKSIDIKTFFSLCAIEKINIFYLHKRFYYENIMDPNNDIHIINKINKYKYGYEGISTEKREEYVSTLLQVTCIDKPIKSMSFYKLNELETMCQKLALETINIDNNKTMSKKELYEKLILYF